MCPTWGENGSESADSNRNRVHARDLAAHDPEPTPPPPPHPSPHGPAGAGRPAPGGHASLGGGLRGRERQPGLAVHRRGGLQHGRGRAHRPRLAAARVGSGHRHGGVGPRHHLRRVLDRARRHRHLDRGVHEDGGALHLHLRHDDGRRRAARRARRGDRQRRLHAHLDGPEPPRRQHRADRDDDRSQFTAHRHRHHRRHRGRHRRLRPRQRAARVQARRRAVDRDLHAVDVADLLRLEHHVARRRALRPAHGRHRRRRQPDDLRPGLQPPRRQHGADRHDDRSRHAARRHDHARLHHRRRQRQRRRRSVRYEYKLGAGAWTPACTSADRPVLVHAQHGAAHRRPLRLPRRSPPTASPRSRPRPR